VTDSIVVRGIRAEGRHGLGAEKDEPQPYVIDVELRIDLRHAAAADRLDATIDYAEVAQATREVVDRTSFDLLETLAEAVASRLAGMGAESVQVRVAKPRAAKALEVEEVAVAVER
jgi:dihydroneopterin aldolase / 2-amino-4-hydroxy-6-hydroxymethyldihydropteridine diphosphokinase